MPTPQSNGAPPSPAPDAAAEVHLPADVESAVKEALRGVVDDDKVPVVTRSLSALLVRLETRHVPAGSLDVAEIEFLDRLAPESHFAERVMELTLQQGELDLLRQRGEIEGFQQRRDNIRDIQRLGMTFGFGLGLVLALGAVACALVGAWQVGVALAGASAFGMVAKFIDAWRH